MTDIEIPGNTVKGEGEGYQIEWYPRPAISLIERLFMALSSGWEKETDD